MLKSKKRRRSRSRSRDRYSRNADKHSPGSSKYDIEYNKKYSSNQEFSFTNYKYELNKMIFSGPETERPVQDIEDFWKFVTKYEALLKKSGMDIFDSKGKSSELNSKRLPTEYNKKHTVFINLKVSPDELQSRFLIDEPLESRGLSRKIIVEKFVDIILYYLDFKNKERFNKLKNLRKVQSNLPVAQYRSQIVEAVKNEQVIIVAGDTGCGKSTQVPQYLYESGFDSIACTQPRRIACISLAKRVSYECLCQYDNKVGYQIRFERQKNTTTKICFITEGLLLRQISSESGLSNYDVIILDEIHERHLHGDFLLGILKCIIQTRKDLKLVLMSATINIKLFSDYFSDEKAVVIEVPGRLFPIQLHYRPILIEGKLSKSERLDPQPYIQIMQLIDSTYPKDEKGDLLIFLSGLQEITSIVDAANQYAEKTRGWIILTLHSSLSITDQDKVFDYPPEGVRKCIVSTNIAETSVTIDGIRFVIDSGKVKEMSYDPSCKMQRLKEFWIPKSSAEQRKGRAGRTGPGVCYRIYSEKDYAALEPYGTPELLRVPLDSLLLLMISLGLNNVRQFPFVDAPPGDSIENAILELKQHNAITSNEKLTPLGKTLAKLPVEIVLGKMLILGSVMVQSEAVLSLAAALSVQTPFTNKAHRDIDCQTSRKPLESDHGDPLTLLNIFAAWLEVKQDSSYGRHSDREKSGGSKQWCKKRGLEEQRFYEITKLRSQFKDLLQDCSLLDNIKNEDMSSAERALRHGQLKQLKDLRRQHRNESADESRKRKRLKMSLWELEGEGIEECESRDKSVDIKNVEFWLANDMKKIQNLISGSSATNHRDLTTLKLILCRALYPQVAIADEFNHCKSVSEQLFHTSNKAFISLHPTSFFGYNPQVLQLEGKDIITDCSDYKSKLPLSSKHQILCYLSLLETTKPYLMNTMRMPAAQTLLLLANCIDTNMSFSRCVCDSWLQLDFPVPETGFHLLTKASRLRKQWDDLIKEKLDDGSKDKKSNKSNAELRYDFSCDLSSYMSTDICYTIKRLLPADYKTTFRIAEEENLSTVPDIDPNPFNKEFKCFPHEKRDGLYLTENIVFGSLEETDWSHGIYENIVNTPWSCPDCGLTMCLNLIERMQHTKYSCKSKKVSKKSAQSNAAPLGDRKSNSKEFICDICKKSMYLTPIEILKHKKNCTTEQSSSA